MLSWAGVLEQGASGGRQPTAVCHGLRVLTVWRIPHSGQTVQMIASCQELPFCFKWGRLRTEQGIRDGTSGANSARVVWSQACLGLTLRLCKIGGWVYDLCHFFQCYLSLPACLSDLTDNKLSERSFWWTRCSWWRVFHPGAAVCNGTSFTDPSFLAQPSKLLQLQNLTFLGESEAINTGDLLLTCEVGDLEAKILLSLVL